LLILQFFNPPSNVPKFSQREGANHMKTSLPSNVLQVMLRSLLLLILCGLFGGCASNPGVGGEVLSGVLMGIGTGLSGL
jgi:hypothetical protein